jgi:hypothetical protein
MNTRHDLTGLVDHLLSISDKLPNRAFIACLKLARLGPKPNERISVYRLIELFGVSHSTYVSQLLTMLRKHDLIDYLRGSRSDPGYQFFRVGPRPLNTK